MNVLTPVTNINVAVLVSTTRARGPNPTLCQKVSSSVAVAGLKADFLASASEGDTVTAGVKINDFAARPRMSVTGRIPIHEGLCAAAIDGMPSKYVTK